MAVPLAELFISVSADTAAAISSLQALNTQLNQTKNAFSQIAPAAQGIQSAGGAVNGLLQVVSSGLSAVRDVVGGVVESAATATASLVALSSAGLVGFGASSFFAAARVNELDTTLRALAAANGLSFASLQQAAAGIQSMGIEAASARQITALLVQNQLDLSKSTLLARTAQDAAVISGQNSTQTLDQLVHGIVTLNTEVIRNAGLTVDIDRAERNYAASLGITFAQLTPMQKQTAVLNAVLDAGTRITGAYAAAMTEPGKVMRSLPRVINDLQVAFGERLLPELGPIIIATFELVKTMGALSAEGQPLGIIFTAIGTALASITDPLLQAITGFQDWLKNLQPEDIANIVSIINDFSGVLAPLLGFIVTIGAQALPIVGKLIAGFNPLAVAFGVLALQNKPIRDFLGSLVQTMARIASDIASSPLVTSIRNVFGQIGTIMEAVLLGHGQDVIDFFTSDLPQPFKDFAGAVGTTVSDFFGTLGTVFGLVLSGNGQDVIEFFKDKLPQPFKDLGTAIGPNVANTFLFLEDVFNAIISGRGQDVIDFFTNKLPQPLKDLGASLEGPIADTFNTISGIFGIIISGNGGLLIDFFKNKLPQPLKDLGTAIGPDVGAFFSGLGTIFGLLLAGRGQEAVDFFKQNLPDAFKALGGAIEGPVGTFFNVLGTIFGLIASGNGGQLVDLFKQSLPDALKNLGSALEGPITATITTFSENVLPKLNTAAEIVRAFWTTQLQPALENPGTALDNLATSFEASITKLGAAAKAGALGPVASDLATFFGQFDAIKAQVASLEPLFTSINNFGLALINLNNALIGLEARTVGSLFESLRSGTQAFHDIAGPAAPVIDALGNSLETIGSKLASVTKFFTDATDAINKLSEAINKTPTALPSTATGTTVTPGGQPSQFGPAPGQSFFDWLQTNPRIFNLPGQQSAQLRQEAFIPGGGPVAGGPIISIGQLIISTEDQADAFLQRMADAVNSASRRVNPPVPAGQPSLVTGTL